MSDSDSRDELPEEKHLLDDRNDQEDEDGSEMSFLEHLEEARKSIIICVIALFVSTTCVFIFLEEVAQFLIMPLDLALGEESPGLHGLITTGPMGVFSVILQVGFIGGFIGALPVILYSIAQFVAPGLKEHEVRIIKPVCLAMFILFLCGAAFSFLVIVPTSLKASMYFNHMLGLDPIWRADSYYGLVSWMVLAIGLSFECPLVIIALHYSGLVTTQQLKQFRPYSFLIFLIIAAMITPTTDPITFLLLAIPMTLLYEGGLQVSAHIERKRQKESL